MHGIAFHAGTKFYDALIANFFHEAFEHVSSEVLVGHFPSAETQAGLYLVAFSQEAKHVVLFGDVIVLVDVDAEFDFLQDNLLLVLLRGPLFLFIFVEKFAVIHDAANWRDSVRRYLYQIKVLFAGFSERFVRGQNSKLVTIGINYPNLSCANALVHANKTFIDAILLKTARWENYSTDPIAKIAMIAKIAIIWP